MKIDVNRLKKALPLVKEYASKRGVDPNQQFSSSGSAPVYGNAISAVIRENKLIRSSYATSYCYASLMNKVKPNDIILLQVQPRHEDQSEEGFRHYLDWVVNYSPWRHAFISKNINRIIKDGVVVVHRGDFPKAYLREACIAVRMAWENYCGGAKYREIDIWWDVAQKVSPNLAYIATKAMTTPLRFNYSIIMLKSSDSGHAPINYSMYDDNLHLNSWLKEELVSRGWRQRSTKPSITRKIMDVINLIGSDGKVVNPFGGARAKEFKRPAFIEAMHSELPKLEADFYA